MGEYRTTQGDALPRPRRERRARLRQGLLIGLLAVMALVAGGYHLQLNRDIPAAGIVISRDYAEVRSPVAAQVKTIHVGSGQTVSSQDLLVQLEDASERADWAAAERLADKAEAELALREAELVEQHRQHLLRLESARQTLEHQRERLELTQKLADQGLASGRDLTDNQHAIRLSEIEYRLLKESDLELDAQRIAVLKREIAVRREAVTQAVAQVQARAIRAPIDGKVLRYPFYMGEVVRPDSILYEVFGGEGLMLRLRVPERYATRVAPGQPCRAKLRSFPSFRPRWFHGEVVEVRDAIQSEAHQTYRVVYASFDPGAETIPPGASADAKIRIGRASLWSVLIGL